MAKVNPGEHGGGEQRPKLVPAVLDNSDGAVLTIKEARTGVPTGDGRKAALLTFKEVPLDDEEREHVLWLNKTDLTILVDKLGDDDEEWVGQRVPVVKVRASNPQTGGYVMKYHIAPADDWDELMTKGRGRGAATAKRRRAKARR